MKSVVLLSGGMDSATVLGMVAEGDTEVHTLSFGYGQKHVAELEQAKTIAMHYGLTHNVVELPKFIFAGAGSALIQADDIGMPQLTYEEIDRAEGPSPTYVPYRNGTFISIAAAFALSIGADEVYAGMHSEDAHNFAYPDCTPEFLGAQAAALYVGSYHEVRLVTPLQWMTKAEIVEAAIRLSVPLYLTMSCYEGTRPACGTCPTCVGRLEAFKMAGQVDPIEYAA